MEESRKWVLPLVLVLVAFIFLVVAIFTPWWSIKTAAEAEIVVNASARIDYTIFQTVIAGIENKTFTGSFSDLTDNQADKDALVSLFNTTFILVIVGLILTILTLAFIFIPKLRSRLFFYTSIITFVAGILFFIAVVNLAANMPPQVSKLSQLAHPDFNVPSSWVSIKPSDVSDFWGSKEIPSAIPFPTWAQGENFWIWGPSFGWHLTFVAALLLMMTAAIIYVMQRIRKTS